MVLWHYDCQPWAAGDGVGYQSKVADFSWRGGGKVGQRLRRISSIDMYLVFGEVNKAYCICEVNHLIVM